MNKLIFVGVLLVVLCAEMDIVQSCGCIPLHPQANFCHAQFVMKIRVRLAKEVESMLGPPDIKYHVKVMEYFKPSRNTQTFPHRPMRTIYTSTSPEACGVTLEKDKVYLVSGYEFMDKLRINVCGWIKDWNQITDDQQAGLRGNYENNCNCEVRTCVDGQDCDPDNNTCILPSNIWTRNGRCLMDSAVCNKSQGKCKWSKPECVPLSIKAMRLLKKGPAALKSRPKRFRNKKKRKYRYRQ